MVLARVVWQVVLGEGLFGHRRIQDGGEANSSPSPVSFQQTYLELMNLFVNYDRDETVWC